MKKIIFSVLAVCLAATSFAQSDKYVKAMEQLVPQVDTTRSITGLTELANSFERIANAEKTQWLPYYYAAVCLINTANTYYMQQQLDQIDPVMEKAEPLLKKAQELEANNSEIFCAVKMLNSGKMMADPMNRFMTYGPAAAEALEKAKALNPENPRVYLLEGIDKFYTPEQFGGSKEEGKKLFQISKEKFLVAKPASSIAPSWGLPQVMYFLSQQ